MIQSPSVRRDLPRLLIITDEAIALGLRGSSDSLARMFGAYPADRLMILQTRGAIPQSDGQMLVCTYQSMPVRWDRLLRTRLSVPANILKALSYGISSRQYDKAVEPFSPDAVISLVHGNAWLVAGRVAKSLNVPLHLIVHDGPAHFHLDYPLIGTWLSRKFAELCKQATSRWSICDALDAHITDLTGVPGSVLAPLRAPGDVGPQIRDYSMDNLDAAYFGALSSVSITAMMNDLAHVLHPFGAKLHAFGGVSPNVVASSAWSNRQFLHHGSFGGRREFLEHCRRSYGFMYLPFSFSDESTRLSFPSKMVDYTMTGLPILVNAPPSSPIGVWCQKNRHAALLVGEIGLQALTRPVEELLASRDLRLLLAENAVRAGDRDFAFAPNWKRFLDTICSGSSEIQP